MTPLFFLNLSWWFGSVRLESSAACFDDVIMADLCGKLGFRFGRFFDMGIFLGEEGNFLGSNEQL